MHLNNCVSFCLFSVRTTLGYALAEVDIADRKDWVLSWPGQVVIAGCQTSWTGLVERGLMENKLQYYFDIILSNV